MWARYDIAEPCVRRLRWALVKMNQHRAFRPAHEQFRDFCYETLVAATLRSNKKIQREKVELLCRGIVEAKN